MSFDSKYSGRIERGDLIAVGFESTIILGLYIGRGKGGTVQYYYLNHFAYLEDNCPDQPLSRWAKSYINSPHVNRIIRVSMETLNNETLIIYEKAMNYLLRNGINLKER